MRSLLVVLFVSIMSFAFCEFSLSSVDNGNKKVSVKNYNGFYHDSGTVDTAFTSSHFLLGFDNDTAHEVFYLEIVKASANVDVSRLSLKIYNSLHQDSAVALKGYSVTSTDKLVVVEFDKIYLLDSGRFYIGIEGFNSKIGFSVNDNTGRNLVDVIKSDTTVSFLVDSNVTGVPMVRLYSEPYRMPLPLIDDFSSSNKLDLTKWKSGSGVYINNNYSNQMLSRGIATFDGADASGRPYKFLEADPNSSSDIKGYTDTLESKAFDFSELDTLNAILSFYVQKGGVTSAIAPERGDSLRLYLLNKDLNWIKVWPNPVFKALLTEQDTSKINPFNYVKYVLRDSAYYHDQFKFRFINYGSQSGTFDVWNLDYVRLDTSTVLYDVGYRFTPNSLLKDYTSLPIKHFLTNPSGYLADSIGTELYNFSTSFSILNDTNVYFKNSVTKEIITEQVTNFKQFNVNGEVINSQSSIPVVAFTKDIKSTLIDYISTYKDSTFVNIQSEFNVLISGSGEGADKVKSNNQVLRSNVLSNYIAYDDGSAESGYGIPGYGFLVVEFNTPVIDTLFSIDFYFPRNGLDYTNLGLNIKVYSALAGVDGAKVDNQLISGYFIVKYDSVQNEYISYNLYEPLILQPGKFYIGYEQSLDESSELNIGLDMNSQNHISKLWYRFSEYDVWTHRSNTELFGAPMIRPYFGKKVKYTTPIKSTEIASLYIYPNPANDRVYVNGWKENMTLVVYSITGDQILFSSEISEGIDVSTLQEGAYIVVISSDDKVFRTKLLITY